MNELNRLIEVFENLIKDGFNLNQLMKWNFYFSDKNKETLVQVINELEGFDYTASIKLENQFYILTTSKIEILSPEKLYNRILAFNKLILYLNGYSFDGWDVEYPTGARL